MGPIEYMRGNMIPEVGLNIFHSGRKYPEVRLNILNLGRKFPEKVWVRLKVRHYRLFYPEVVITVNKNGPIRQN